MAETACSGERRKGRRDAAGLDAKQRIGGTGLGNLCRARCAAGPPRPQPTGARRGLLRPAPAMAFRQMQLASPALPATRCRTAAPARRTPPRPGRAGSRRARGRSPVMHPEPYSTPSKASRPARSVTPTASRGAAGAASVRVVTAVSIASTKAGVSKPASASWNEARFSTKPGTVPSRPCQIGVDGDPWRSRSMRCRRSDSGISSPARSALSAIGRIQASAAVASMTGCSPGTSAAKAAAAASSQAAGSVTSRGGASGSAPTVTRCIRTPCHARVAFMRAC